MMTKRNIRTYIRPQIGLSLIELLASLTIFSLIMGFLTTVLIMGINQFSQVQAEALLRDEADIVMTRFAEQIYPAYDVVSTIDETEEIDNPQRSLVTIKHKTAEGSAEPYEDMTLGFEDDQALIAGEALHVDYYDFTGSTIEHDEDNNLIIITLQISDTNNNDPVSLELNSRITLLTLE